MSLQFACEIPWNTWKDALSDVVAQRTDTTNEWRLLSHQKIPRAQADELFVEVSESDAATLTISVTDGGGDPRYGEIQNNIDIKLLIKTTNESLRLTGSSMSTYPRNEPLSVDAPTIELKEQLRQALRSRLGAEHDRSMQATLALPSIREAQKQSSHLAILWVDEALSLPPQSYGWAELLRLAEEIHGQTEASLARRLQEAPCDQSAWSAAKKSPPAGSSKEVIEAMLRRFETTLPTGARWRRCEDGVGPGGRRTPIGRMLFHSLFGFRFGAEDPSQFTYESKPSSWHMKRTKGELPATLHEFSQELDDVRIAVSCIWGERADDLACIQMAIQKPSNLFLGEALCIKGSEEFQDRVKQGLAKIAPFRWVETEEHLLFAESAKRDLQLVERGASPEEQIAKILSLAGLPSEFAELTGCQCKVICEHHKKINDARKDLQIAYAPLPSAESFRALAKIAALQLIQMFIYQKKIDPLALQNTEENIARCQAICEEQPLF